MNFSSQLVLIMSDQTSPEKSPWGWKALILFTIGGILFLGFFYLAVSNEPDYMPSQKAKENTQQHAFKNAPAMSQEALDKAQADKAEREAMSADMHNMSADEHAQMSDASSAHGH